NFGRGFTQVTGTGSPVQEFIDAVNNAQKAFETSSRELEAANVGGLVPLLPETAKSIDQLQSVPSIAPEADGLTAEMLRLMQDQYDLIQDVEKSGTVTLSHGLRLKDNMERYGKVMESIFKWVDTDGRR